jgi:hypothetical protein
MRKHLQLPDPQAIEDVPSLPRQAVFVLSSPLKPQHVLRVVEAACTGLLVEFGVLHLGDEFLGRIPRGFSNGRELYDLPQCKWVLRHYYDHTLTSPRISTLVLGPKVMRHEAAVNGLRDLAWSCACDPRKSGRAAVLSALAQVQPNRVHCISGWGAVDSLDPTAYSVLLSRSVFVPCPPGNYNQDTFRLYEALEHGALPLVLTQTPAQPFDYWSRVFGPGHPLIVLSDWSEGVSRMRLLLEDPHALGVLQSKTRTWWAEQRHNMQRQVADAVASLVTTESLRSAS